MKKIALIINGLYTGGAENQFVKLAIGLNKKKYKVDVFVLYGHGDLTSTLVKTGMNVYHLNPKYNPIYGSFLGGVYASLIAYSKLRKIFKKNKYDIVHSYLPHANIITRLANRGLGAYCISSIRVMELKYTWQTKVDKLTKQYVDLYTTNSYVVERFIQESLDIDENKTKVIYNGVDFNKYKTTNKAKIVEEFNLEGKKVVTMVANFREQKDHLTVVKALNNPLLAKLNIACLFVGFGPTTEKVDKLVIQLGLEDTVHILGYRSDIPDILAATDVFVLSTHYEGSPNTVIEAMASKTPVIASDIPENKEIICDDSYGLLFREGMSFSLAQAIETILSSPKLYNEIKNNGYKRAKELFDEKRLISEHDKIYRECY